MFKIPFYTFYLVLLFGLLSSYLCCVTYIKQKRKNGKPPFNVFYLFFLSIIFGSPATIIMELCFREIKEDDQVQRYSLLWSTIALLAVHIIVIVFLFYFQVFDMTNGGTNVPGSQSSM